MKRQSSTLAKNFQTTFLSCEKDQETILKKLFVESKPYSDNIKKLLVVNTKDCLDPSQYQYNEMIRSYSLKRLRDEGYVRVIPKLEINEHEKVKSYILLEFDDFAPSQNEQFRNCVISFTIVSLLNEWELDDYKLRPWQIAGYIDGLLNKTKLSGIGTLNFMGASQVIFNEHFGGVLLRYIATHGSAGDDAETVDPDMVPPMINQNIKI